MAILKSLKALALSWISLTRLARDGPLTTISARCLRKASNQSMSDISTWASSTLRAITLSGYLKFALEKFAILGPRRNKQRGLDSSPTAWLDFKVAVLAPSH